ncbi:DUF4158 domain-containing protein [Streptomyces sp. NBC_00322]|uniref:DUF4158 domain-containing protein n=1 Tax=Streptomyces sp. NBC_00322 TaxID=2975712 RepID=UPI003FA75DCC
MRLSDRSKAGQISTLGFSVATRVFADDELRRLRGFPEFNKEELIRFVILTSADVGFIDPGRGRSPKDRLGRAVQLCNSPGRVRPGRRRLGATGRCGSSPSPTPTTPSGPARCTALCAGASTAVSSRSPSGTRGRVPGAEAPETDPDPTPVEEASGSHGPTATGNRHRSAPQLSIRGSAVLWKASDCSGMPCLTRRCGGYLASAFRLG